MANPARSAPGVPPSVPSTCIQLLLLLYADRECSKCLAQVNRKLWSSIQTNPGPLCIDTGSHSWAPIPSSPTSHSHLPHLPPTARLLNEFDDVGDAIYLAYGQTTSFNELHHSFSANTKPSGKKSTPYWQLLCSEPGCPVKRRIYPTSRATFIVYQLDAIPLTAAHSWDGHSHPPTVKNPTEGN